MQPIFLFLTTGRCGTQWLTANLTKLYDRYAVATHEPLGAGYMPRRHFRRYRHEDRDHPAVVRKHLKWVEEVAADRIYIETGWPLFASIPLFLKHFGERVRIVHLVRHLVPVVVSHTVHQCYYGSPRRDEYTRWAVLDPSLPGAIQEEEEKGWRSLSPFEKCLFWCTEVHLYARELRRLFPEIPFHLVKAEDLFAGEDRALRDLTAFLGLPFEPDLVHRSAERVDEWHHRTKLEFEWRTIFDHPAAVEVARSFGYDLDAVDQKALDRRYRGEPPIGATPR